MSHPKLTFQAEMSLALTYALRRPNLAKECVRTAISAAIEMNRPDLAWQAANLLEVLS